MKRSNFIAALLAFALVLTGQTMAVARGAAPASGQMVLCVGEASVVVYVDASGVPTSAPHFCPDCTVMDALGVLALRVAPPHRLAVSVRETLPRPLPESQPRTISYLSRAPPVGH